MKRIDTFYKLAIATIVFLMLALNIYNIHKNTTNKKTVATTTVTHNINF